MVRLRLVPTAVAAAAVLAALPAIAPFGQPAYAARVAPVYTPPKYDDIMPLSHVRAGMTGYGLTVFHGTTIERFAVTVVGVVKKGSLVVPGHDMILVRMSGGPMTTRQANLIKGMSGSPVYIDGKIIGAFSQGEPAAREPLGGVTPIEDMLEAWDPKLPASPLTANFENTIRTAELAQPLQVGDRTIRKVVYNVPMSSRLRSHGDTLVMHPCTTFATFSCTSKSVRDKLAKALAPYNVELAQGISGGQKAGFKGAPLVPGAAFSMMLVTGDMSAGATGTVSYRRGNRILGFGHPFMGIGPIEAPLTSAYIYDVYPLLASSYKISSPGPVVGTSTQDRNFSVSGLIGVQPRTIPVTVVVNDQTTGRSRVFHNYTVHHPSLYAAMVSASVGASIAEIRSTPGPAMARVTTTVDVDEIGKVTRTNEVFDARGIDNAATGDLDDLLGILTSNPFYPLGIKSANVKVDIWSGRQTAQVERIFLKEGKFEPGETVDLGVVIKPYKKDPVTKTIQIKIPQNTPSGRYVVQVRGGAVPAGINLGGIIIRPSGGGSAQEQAPPASIRQMVNRYDEREKNNEVVARLLLPTTAVNIEGERLSDLPPSLDALMRSAKSSGVRLERDEVKVVQPTDWVVSGQQLLAINVQRHDSQESPSSASSSTRSTTPQPVTVGSGSGQTFDQETNTGDAGDGDGETGADNAAIGAYGRADRQMAALGPGRRDDRKDDKKDDKKNQRGKKGAEPAAAAPPPESATPSAAPTPAPAATTTETNDKPVGRPPVIWRQTTRADFSRGDAQGVSVTTLGDLTLTRSLKRLQTSGESFLWSLVSDGKGGVYAGTGTQGRVLRVAADGTLSTFAKLPELTVHGLYRGQDGILWAATGPHGRVYRIAPDGKAAVAFDPKDPQEKYALAIIGDASGDLYVGTGGGKGAVYKIAPGGAVSTLFQTPEEHVLALALDKSGNVYAGTSSAGIVYKITPDGKGSVLYDAPEASITAVGVNSKGDVYAVTAPKGVVYRIAQDGTATVVFNKAPAAFTALRVASDDTVYAAGGSAVYAIQPDDTVTPIANRTDIDILSLDVDSGGSLYAGTGNVAEVYVAPANQPKASGVYESVVHDAKQPSRWGAIRWTGVAPAGTRLAVETRTGNVAEPDSTWSPWAAPRQMSDGAQVESPAARYIQYRVTLESDTPQVSPALRDVAITYLPRNQAPTVTFAAPAGGERWANKQTLRWTASDPDKDTLTYQLYFSTDNGAHWSPVPAGTVTTTTTTTTTTPAKPAATAPPTLAEAAASAPPSVAAVAAELDKHPDLPAALREAVLERARKVNEEYAANHGAGAAPAAATGSATTLRETSRSLDTKLLADGTYLFKVVATDAPSNPVDARTADAISEPVVICNAAPSVFLLHTTAQVHPDHTVTLEGAAMQTRIAVTAVQFRVDGGEWLAAVPKDGIFDSPLENFTVTTGPLAPGSHTVEVKAFNAANLTGTDKATVEVK